MVLGHLPLLRTARPSCVHGDVPGSSRVHAGPGSHPACQNWSCSWSLHLHVFSRDHMKIYEWKTCIPKSREGRDWFVGLEQPIDGVEEATVGRALCQTTHRQGTDMLKVNKDVLKSQERNRVGIWPWEKTSFLRSEKKQKHLPRGKKSPLDSNYIKMSKRKSIWNKSDPGRGWEHLLALLVAE